jgi:hypothetical protein
MEIVITDRFGRVNWYLMDGPEEIESGVIDDLGSAGWREALTLADKAREQYEEESQS